MKPIGSISILIALFSLGCSPWEMPQRTVDQYILAVQNRDLQAAFRLTEMEFRKMIAGNRVGDSLLDRYGESMEDLHRRFEKDRKEGQLVFTPEGIALIRGLGLGRGAFYRHDYSRSAKGSVHAVMVLNVVLPYNLLDQSNDKGAGTVFWRLGPPFGRIYPIFSGLSHVGEREELHSIQLRVDLVSCPSGEEHSPTGWCIQSFQPLPETAEYDLVLSSLGIS